MTSGHFIVTMTLDTIVVFDSTVAFVIPLIALLTSMPVMWHEEHLWNFSVLQGVHLSSLVCKILLTSKSIKRNGS
jgi:hypothetical protein